MAQTSSVSMGAKAPDGGSFRVSAGDRSLDELLRIASAAARSRSRIELTGTRAKPLEDLMRIAVAGGPSVVFGHERDESSAPPRPAGRWWFSRRTAD